MRWSVFLISAFLLASLEVGLRPLWVMPIGPYLDAAPSLLLILGVFLCLNTSAGVVSTAMILLGLVSDVTQPVGKLEPIRDIVLLGPATLGFLLAAFVCVQLRHLVYRDSVITMIVMTLVAGLFTQLAVVAIISLRTVVSADVVPDWQPMSQLIQRSLGVLYSMVLALPLGFVLIRSRRMWQFHSLRSTMIIG